MGTVDDDTLPRRLTSRHDGPPSSSATGPPPEAEVWALCAALGLSRGMLGNGAWRVGVRGVRLAHSDRLLVCLARALLSAPNLVLIAGALDGLAPVTAGRVISVLRSLAAQRGLPALLPTDYAAGPALVERRTEVTVVFSTCHEVLAGLADRTLALEYGSADDGAC